MRKLNCLFLDFSTRLQTIRDLEVRPRGGMVSSLFAVSDQLALRGHTITVLADVHECATTKAGVQWINVNAWEDRPYDVLICNRGVGSGYDYVKAKRRVLWTHDLPHNGFIQNPQTIRAFAMTVFMSRYAENVWRHFYSTIGKASIIPNGVNRSLFHPRDKDWNYMIYASHPTRGLKRLPLIFDAVKSQMGNGVYLNVYSNANITHPAETEKDDHGDQFAMEWTVAHHSGYQVMDPIPQTQLAEEIGRAGLMVMPTGYPEICSNLVLQALVSGTPIVTTGGLGSAPEWVKDGWNGKLTKFHPEDYMIHTLEITRGCVEILSNLTIHQRMSNNAAETPNIPTWEEIGKRWDKMLRGIM